MAWTSAPASGTWHWGSNGHAEDAEMDREDQQEDMDCESPHDEADPYQTVYIGPRSANRTKVSFDQNERQPLYKNALMTATAKHLGVGVGKGLAQAQPASEMYENTNGFKLMAKGMALWMLKKGGECQPFEKVDDYLKRITDSNTPVLNAAVAWGSAAEKKVNKFIRRTKRARDSETSEDAPLRQHFTQRETPDPQESIAGPLSAMSQEIRPDEDEVVAPPPVLATAFTAEVWPQVDRESLSTAEIQREIEQSVETPRDTGHSDVDFGGEDAETSGDQ